MLCPFCGHENLPGADICAACSQELSFLDEPSPGSAVERILMEDPVRFLRPSEPICVAPDTQLRAVIQLMADKRIGCVLVTDGPELLGIFTERDVLMKIAGRESETTSDPVSEWMTANPETIEYDDSIAYALHKMDVGGYRHLPVMQAGRIRGVISVRDVIRLLAAQPARAQS